jgi:predicted butyrate kinase (DUF1464 family)
MEAKFSTPVNRLASRAGSRGVTKTDAVAKASANVETLRDVNMNCIDENLEKLRNLLLSTKKYSEASVQELYDASNSIFGTSALFGLDALGRGAYSLCELLSQFEAAQVWSAPAVKIHLDSMGVLRKLNGIDDAAKATEIVKSLFNLVQHFEAKSVAS